MEKPGSSTSPLGPHSKATTRPSWRPTGSSSSLEMKPDRSTSLTASAGTPAADSSATQAGGPLGPEGVLQDFLGRLQLVRLGPQGRRRRWQPVGVGDLPQPGPGGSVGYGDGEPRPVTRLVDAVTSAVAGLLRIEHRAGEAGISGQERPRFQKQSRAQKRGSHRLTGALPAPGVKSGHGGARRHPTTRGVDGAPVQESRRLSGTTLGPFDARQGLHEMIVARQGSAGTVGSEAAGEAVHDAGVDRPNVLLAVAQLLGQSQPRVVVQHVAPPEELLQHQMGVGRFQIESQGAFAALAGGVHGLHTAVGVAGRGFHLDDVGAQLGQDLGRYRPGQVGGEIQDADSGEQPGRRPPPVSARAGSRPSVAVTASTAAIGPRPVMVPRSGSS